MKVNKNVSPTCHKASNLKKPTKWLLRAAWNGQFYDFSFQIFRLVGVSYLDRRVTLVND